MSAQLEAVEDEGVQLAFEGLQVNRVRFSGSFSDEDCRLDDEPQAVNIGDRIILAEGAELEVTEVHFTEKRKELDNGRSIGVGPVTRKHSGKFTPGSIVIKDIIRRESDEDRARRLTR